MIDEKRFLSLPLEQRQVMTRLMGVCNSVRGHHYIHQASVTPCETRKVRHPGVANLAIGPVQVTLDSDVQEVSD